MLAGPERACETLKSSWNCRLVSYHAFIFRFNIADANEVLAYKLLIDPFFPNHELIVKLRLNTELCQ